MGWGSAQSKPLAPLSAAHLDKTTACKPAVRTESSCPTNPAGPWPLISSWCNTSAQVWCTCSGCKNKCPIYSSQDQLRQAQLASHDTLLVVLALSRVYTDQAVPRPAQLFLIFSTLSRLVFQTKTRGVWLTFILVAQTQMCQCFHDDE